MKQLRWHKVIIIKQIGTLLLAGAVALSTFGSTQLHAEDGLSYFEIPDIDYWSPSKNPAISKSEKQKESVAPVTKKDSNEKPSAFPWKKYLDPKNDEFFKEGDYTPPAPFMEIARNPSDENVANWYQYLHTKNELAQRLQAKLSEYASKHVQFQGETAEPEAIVAATKRIPAPVTQTDVDPSKIILRMYFDSHCPHCEDMMDTLTRLSQKGYGIELSQVDSDPIDNRKIHFPVQPATPIGLKKYKVKAVPVLVVANFKAQNYFIMDGFQTESDVLREIQAHANQKSNNQNKKGLL